MTREITLCDTSAIKEAEACVPLSSTSIKKMQQKKNTDEDDLVSVLTAACLGKYTAVLQSRRVHVNHGSRSDKWRLEGAWDPNGTAEGFTTALCC